MTNAVGNPIRGWDSRDHVVRSVYDVLHRRTELRVQSAATAEVLAEQTVYGDGLPTPEATNLRGKVYQVNDGAGVVTNVEYDFKGNLLTAHRQLAAAFSGQIDWSLSVALETEMFVQQTQYDALNRPTTMTTPDQSVLRPEYNEAGLLERVDAKVRGIGAFATFVDDIDYDAKGQRESITYGNGVVTEYEYDELTFRVKRIKTTRAVDSALLQDLRYFYDAVGNIVETADLAQSAVYYDNDVMAAVSKYEYDAIYRLIHATGREHAGQNANIQQDAYGFPLVNAPNANDPQAMRNYEESYEYDVVGNIKKMIHATVNAAGSWTRRYDVATTNNRLLGTSLPSDGPNQFAENYPPDAHGNMQSMPHLDSMDWDFKDQLAHVVKSGAGDVYFTYDASGQRVRKVWVHSGITEERIYLGGFELYRRHENGGVVLERETLHIMDDTRRIAMVETKTIDTSVPNLNVVSRTRYQCSNHLGSATLELDETGQVISYEEYHPYGTSAYRATNGSVEVSAKRYRYTGKERDEETGLYYHGARYYACWLGRWTSADPAGMVDGTNVFVYVRNRPTALHDPTGRVSAPIDVYSSAGHEVAEHPEGGFYAVSDSEGVQWDPRQVDSVPVGWENQSDEPTTPPIKPKPRIVAKPAAIKATAATPSKPEAPAAAEGAGSFLEGALLGGFADNDSWSATAGSVVVGFIPIVGQIADIRDIGAAIEHISEGKPGGWLELGLSAIGLIPGGDVVKGIAKGTSKGVAKGSAKAALAEAAELAKRAMDRAPIVRKEAKAAADAARLERKLAGANAVGKLIGESVVGQNERLAKIAKKITDQGLSQVEAVEAARSAARVLFPNINEFRIGPNVILTGRTNGIDKVLVMRPDGTVVQTIGEVIEEAGRWTVRNIQGL